MSDTPGSIDAVPSTFKDHSRAALAGLVILLGALLMRPFGDFAKPGNVIPFLGAAALLSAGFLLGLRVRQPRLWVYWALAIGPRLILFGMDPGDDMARYLWEGKIQLAGFCPYCDAPASPALQAFRDPAWTLIKHQEVTAIYPPLTELIFRGIAAVSPSAAAMKIVFVSADLAICWLLVRSFGSAAALRYAWNPLVIYSFSGGGHYDSLFVLSMTAAALLWAWGNRRMAAPLLGAGVALKWLCLPLLGWAFWRIARKDGIGNAAIALGLAALPFGISWTIVAGGRWDCPLIPAAFTRVARSSEAIPSIATWLLPPEHFWNTNSAYLILFLIGSAAILLRQRVLHRAAYRVLSLALLTTPMFHAWYGTWIASFAAMGESRGSTALSVSVFVYFWLHHTVGQPGGIWHQSVWEKLLLWVPFAVGLAWDLWKREDLGAIES